MSNPQLENGYTRLANELLDAIGKASFTATQYKILLCILRYTYGFGRKSHLLSATFIAEWTGSGLRTVKRELGKLIEVKVILVFNSELKGTTHELSLNKDYSSWLTGAICCTGATQETGAVNDTGATQETGAVNDTGATQETGAVNDTGSIQNTGAAYGTGSMKGTGATYGTGATHGTGAASDTGLVPSTALEPVPCRPPKKEKIKEKYKENIYEHFFENLWQSYPRKLGKGGVTKKAKKELYDAGMDVVTEAIKKYRRETEHQEERFILYGSTFFNGRWKDYVTAPKQQPQRTVQEEGLFDRFRNLPAEVFQDFRERGIISDEGGVCCGEATEEQILILQKAGAL